MSRRKREPRRHTKVKVHVLVAELKHGSWVRVFSTKRALDVGLADYIRDDWTDTLKREQARQDAGSAPDEWTETIKVIPHSNKDMIDQYVELMNGDFSYWTDEVEIES